VTCNIQLSTKLQYNLPPIRKNEKAAKKHFALASADVLENRYAKKPAMGTSRIHRGQKSLAMNTLWPWPQCSRNLVIFLTEVNPQKSCYNTIRTSYSTRHGETMCPRRWQFISWRWRIYVHSQAVHTSGGRRWLSCRQPACL